MHVLMQAWASMCVRKIEEARLFLGKDGNSTIRQDEIEIQNLLNT